MWNAFPTAMNEFKFVCPVCGQHIKCDSLQGGSTIECPTCFQKIIAPQAPAVDDMKFILTGTKVGERPGSASATNEGTAISTGPAKKFPTAAIAVAVLLCVTGGVGVCVSRNHFQTEPRAGGRSGRPHGLFVLRWRQQPRFEKAGVCQQRGTPKPDSIRQ